MRKRGFTLIELLVVIAIIAILAAILFPVFAQAKMAAKKTSSLSNNKQIALAALMYADSYDDGLPLLCNGPADLMGNYDGTHRVDSWVWQIQPYIKSLRLMVDPSASDSANIFGSGPYAWFRNQNLFPYYGYNYMFLSPWVNCDHAESRTSSAATEPANTVFFVESRHPDYTSALGYYTAAAPGMYGPIVASANYCCYTDTGWAKHPTANPNTPMTGETALRYSNGNNATWLDGHAKYMKDDALAAGTDYGTSSDPSATAVTDKSQYLWNFDDNYFGG